MNIFNLPDLGEGLPEAEIVEWHVNEHDDVTVDQIILSVETAKAIVDVPSPCTGTIERIFVQVGDVVKTGEPLLTFCEDTQSSSKGITTPDKGAIVGDLPNSSDVLHSGFSATSAHAYLPESSVTKGTRKLAEHLGVDLSTVIAKDLKQGISSADITEAYRVNQQHGKPEKLKGVRRSMANNMSAIHAEVPQVTLFDDADINHWPSDEDISLRLVQAISSACYTVPDLNCWYDHKTKSRLLLKQVDIGIAVDTEAGLFVPVMRDVGNRDRDDLREGLDKLKQAVNDRSIPLHELQGATITLSNFGTLSGRYATPMVVPPSVAILGSGAIQRDVIAIGESMKIHRRLPLSLSFDHRVVTGGEASRFLAAIIKQLAD